LSNHEPIRYGRICLATGGVPRAFLPNNPLVVTLRDTESVFHFRSRLEVFNQLLVIALLNLQFAPTVPGARRVLLVGNGGIATEVAYEIEDCQVVWVVKHENISVPFLDTTAAYFLLQSRKSRSRNLGGSETLTAEKTEEKTAPLIQTLRYSLAERQHGGEARLVPAKEASDSSSIPFGSALGPDWAQGLKFTGIMGEKDLARPLKLSSSCFYRYLLIVYNSQVVGTFTPDEFKDSGLVQVEADSDGNLLPEHVKDWPIYARLSNGDVYGCDFIINATGVDANLGPETSSGAHAFAKDNPALRVIDRAHGGGIIVDEFMQSSIPEVYAVGDCAYAGWKPSPHWFQMRLWSQARQMAFQAAKSMFFHSQQVADVPQDFSFELFSHVTFFFGFKVVLLGLFNGQGLDLTAPNCHLLMRISPGETYVKCVMKDGRMQGALLIGETELEETFENLILNQLDLTSFGEHLLDPNIDLSDFFD
uniref:Pyridine nucleotide-disulfide oxidoreductase domain-containing protein 1 n=1 Tax=Schistocephalus solidus TaxID=70667 RepID=A0A183SYM0_SCHSO